MATRKVKVEGSVSAWNNKVPFPKDCYRLRCIEEDFSLSKSSGNPMITRVWEILAKEPVAIGENLYDIDGLKINQYVTVKVKSEDGDGWDTEKSDKAWNRFAEEALILGLDPEEECDDENPPLIAKGKIVDAIVYAKEDVARKSPTPEQARKGMRQGDPIKDPNTGKDVKTYQLSLETVLGLSTEEAHRPF